MFRARKKLIICIVSMLVCVMFLSSVTIAYLSDVELAPATFSADVVDITQTVHKLESNVPTDEITAFVLNLDNLNNNRILEYQIQVSNNSPTNLHMDFLIENMTQPVSDQVCPECAAAGISGNSVADLISKGVRFDFVQDNSTLTMNANLLVGHDTSLYRLTISAPGVTFSNSDGDAHYHLKLTTFAGEQAPSVTEKLLSGNAISLTGLPHMELPMSEFSSEPVLEPEEDGQAVRKDASAKETVPEEEQEDSKDSAPVLKIKRDAIFDDSME